MSCRPETRVLYYAAPLDADGERILADGFRDERTDESRQQLGVVLYEQPAYFDRYQVAGQIIEVAVTLPEEEFERAVVTVSGVPTGKYLFSAAVLNAHAKWRAVTRDDVDTPDARTALEQARRTCGW